jgi:hypothetical protein
MTQPTILPDYRARCCGTCKHNKQEFLDGGIVDCELGAEPRDIFSFCVGNYEPEEY